MVSDKAGRGRRTGGEEGREGGVNVYGRPWFPGLWQPSQPP